ncbi:ATP-binding protein [Kitasatospora sp. NPDC085895]|uniref:ATP-binding protein n=1 Tax=Kitasatospora sp. NPDC085895 TaxID=3155057 RepID=UPI00344CDC0C
MYATSLIDSPARRRVAGGGGTALLSTLGTAAVTADAVMVIRPQAPAPAPARPVEGTWPLEHRPEAAAQARRIARGCLDAWQIGDDAQDAVLLVVSELVTNAVEHAMAPVRLHLHRTGADGRMWVGVSDGGPAPRDGAWTRSCTSAEHGRGLNVVQALAEQHGTRT